jgi:hypothetical protein
MERFDGGGGAASSSRSAIEYYLANAQLTRSSLLSSHSSD